MSEQSLHDQIQALCEAYLGRKFQPTDFALMRKFLNDLQRQNLTEEIRDTKPEIVTVRLLPKGHALNSLFYFDASFFCDKNIHFGKCPHSRN